MRVISKIIIMILLVSTLTTCTINVQGPGLGVGPSFIILDNAVRNETYQQTMFVFNEDERDANIVLETEGDIISWVEFFEYSANGNYSDAVIITSVFVPSQGYRQVSANIVIPADAASKQYNGYIVATLEPISNETDNGTSSSVHLGIPVPVSINVTGDQIIEVNVTRLEIDDEEEVNRPCKIHVGFENTGNVVAEPVVEILITKDDMYIDKLTYSGQIRQGRIATYDMTWDTTGRPSGVYNAFFDITLNGKSILQENKTVKLLPTGTYTRNGTLFEITYDGELKKGNLIKIISVFRNTGEVEVNAKFVGEVYRDGELIQKLESIEKSVPRYIQKSFITYLTIGEDGDYSINGYCVYDGIETSAYELEFTVGAKGIFGITSGALFSNFGIVLLIMAILLITIIILDKKGKINVRSSSLDIDKKKTKKKKKSKKEKIKKEKKPKKEKKSKKAKIKKEKPKKEKKIKKEKPKKEKKSKKEKTKKAKKPRMKIKVRSKKSKQTAEQAKSSTKPTKSTDYKQTKQEVDRLLEQKK